MFAKIFQNNGVYFFIGDSQPVRTGNKWLNCCGE